MYQSHGMAFAEYSRKLTNRLQVEQEREKNYFESRQVGHEMKRLAHR
ncbi:hypothetical protein [Aquibacillus sediminis]|nr:hypothetical protein [Aquibacillus sediminis]